MEFVSELDISVKLLLYWEKTRVEYVQDPVKNQVCGVSQRNTGFIENDALASFLVCSLCPCVCFNEK